MIKTSIVVPHVGRMGVNIVLPQGFRSIKAPLPVLILMEAQNHWTNRGPYGGWHTDSSTAWLIRTRQIRPIVIVGINQPPWRDRVYAPPPWGRSGILADHIANVLLPRLRPQFRLTADRRQTGIIGSSFAANFVLEAGLFRPDAFGLIGSFSAAPHAGESLPSMLSKRNPLPFHKLYIDAGTKWAYDDPYSYGGDNTAFNRKLIEIARRRMPAKSFYGKVFPGHFHTEEFWRKRVGRAIKFLYSA